MKLAIVYDWIDKWGGAERILQTVFDAYPTADIYTLYADYSGAKWALKYKKRIQPTFLQNFYRFIPIKQWLVPAMPFAIESLNLSDYTHVLSIGSSFAKGVITRPETKHISYVFTPTRFLWLQREMYLKGNWIPAFAGMTKSVRDDREMIKWLREWDSVAAVRPDEIVTLSQFSRKNIEAVYKRKSEILYPPFDISHFRRTIKSDKKPSVSLPSSYFLFVGRLEPYKRVDLLVETWAKGHKENLVIIGTGTEQKKLITVIKDIKNITFITTPLSDAELTYVYKHARALIMPQAEDFGYTALEALYTGTPVVSFKYSGAADMVTDGENGILFNEQNVYELNKALDRVSRLQYNKKEGFFESFGKERFLDRLGLLLH